MTVSTVLHRLLGSCVQASHQVLDALGGRVPVVAAWDARRSLRRLRRSRDRWARLDSQPGSWASFEARRWSQNGEDGLIAELVRRVGAPGRYFVEIGSSDGGENCTRALAEDGWRGLWIEADPDRVRLARDRGLESVRIAAAFARRSTITQLLDEHDVPDEPDVLVVDIDGDDLGVLRSVLRTRRPRILVLEYNGSFRPPAAWSLPESAARGWDGTDRFGASLQAWVDELRHLGPASADAYELVLCDRAGVNAFFVRRDLAAGVPLPRSARAAYRPPSFSRHPVGHVRSRSAVRPPVHLTLEDVTGITLRSLRAEGPTTVRGDGTVGLSVEVRNGGGETLTSGAPGGCRLVLRWADGDEPPAADAARTPLPHPIPPGTARRVVLWSPAPAERGHHRLRVTAVVEGVAWLESLDGDGRALDLDVVVD